MKPTKENDLILRKLGFIREAAPEEPIDKYDWYYLEDDGWSFRLDGIKSFKHLVKRLSARDLEAMRNKKESLIKKYFGIKNTKCKK